MMKSIEKLREKIRLDVNNPWSDLRGDLLAMCGEIEAEIAEKYMELPLDADGVPIHVGDELETSEYGKRFTCTGYSYQTEGYEKPHWSIAYRYDDYDGTTEFVSLRSCRHVKPRTIEDVLKDYALEMNTAYNSGEIGGEERADTLDALTAKYADELRGMGVGE